MPPENIFAPLVDTVSRFAEDLVSIIPKVVLGAVIIVIGYAVGRLVGETIRIVASRVFGIDRWVRQKELGKELQNIQISSLLGDLAKWFIYLLFVSSAVIGFGPSPLKDLFDAVLNLYPKFVAIIIVFLFGLVFGEWLKQRVVGKGFILAKDIGSLVKFSTVFVLVVVGLEAVGLQVTLLLDIVRIVVFGIVGVISVALGIALGLALKDEIRPYVKRFLVDRFGGEEKKPGT